MDPFLLSLPRISPRCSSSEIMGQEIVDRELGCLVCERQY